MILGQNRVVLTQLFNAGALFTTVSIQKEFISPGEF